MTMMKVELQLLREKLGDNGIDKLYMFSCLIGSGFDDDKAYDLINLLNELWLKDENNTSISTLSDMLYNIYDDIKDDIDKMGTREILIEMYLNY